MDSISTPDSWEQNDDGGSGDQENINQVGKGLGGLNVNATPFVPGQNVFAKEFVPSFGNNSSNNTGDDSGPDSKEAKAATEENSIATDPPDKSDDGEAPDDWTDKASENSSSPDEGGGSSVGTEEDESTGGATVEVDDMPVIPVVSKKKRLPSETQEEEKKKDHLNIVFIGHVDAGKSTIGGHIMYLTGMVEKRTLEKYEREAKEKNRESWYLSWALDTNLEEREKGKTVEVGRAYFETDTKHFTILDAPGHRSFVPNMIGGASQADLSVLVISARRGEFETGFERGGQTREHAMLVKTAGVKQMVIVVNKMDDPTVRWDEERYEEIKTKLTPYLKKCGFNPKTDIFYIPVSGLTGANLKERSTECPWYSGPSLITYLDQQDAMQRAGSNDPVRLPIVDRYKDMGTIVLGKVESGTISKGQILTIMPNKAQAEIMTVWSDENEVDSAEPGENVKLKLKNVEEDDVSPGFVLCSNDSLCRTGKIFDAQIVILEHKSIICAGYSAVLHLHCCAEEVTIKNLICLVDKKGEKSKTRPRFIKQDQIAIVRFEVCAGAICLEAFKEFPQMGRFTLRDEGRTIAIGKVLKVIG